MDNMKKAIAGVAAVVLLGGAVSLGFNRYAGYNIGIAVNNAKHGIGTSQVQTDNIRFLFHLGVILLVNDMQYRVSLAQR